MRVLALLAGVILLLPGLCSAGFVLVFIPLAGRAGAAGGILQFVFSPLGLLCLVCFLISFGGAVIIRNALRGPNPPAAPREERPPSE